MQRIPSSASARLQKQPSAWRRTISNVIVVALLAMVVVAGGIAVAQNRDAGQHAAQAADGYTSPASYTPPPKPTTVAFVGDSVTVGTGATHKGARWTSLVAQEKGWLELNYGVGGTNYASTGPVAKGKAYQDHLTDLIISDPDIVIVSSAGNGMEENQAPGIKNTFRTLQEQLPDAEIYATSPYPGAYRTVHAEFADDIKAEVEASGGVYLELEDPLEERPAVMDEDGFHPNDVGHRIIADTVLDALQGQ